VSFIGIKLAERTRQCIEKYTTLRHTLLQVKRDFQEIVLSARQDEFFRKNMYANFGDVGVAVKVLVGSINYFVLT